MLQRGAAAALHLGDFLWDSRGDVSWPLGIVSGASQRVADGLLKARWGSRSGYGRDGSTELSRR
eukprot:5807663-Pyramimonas_sp.AAC.1